MAARKGPVSRAVEDDLRALAARDAELAAGALAATALALARELDKPDNSATSKSMCAKALIEAMERLRELAPPAEEADKLDEISARRVARRAAGGAGA